MIEFTKMSGSGNDFILIDNIGGALKIDDLPAFARRVCKRKVSVGADGLILIEKSDRADFRWQFFNADGSRADMCGNGGRCAARFAFVREITGPRMSFETGAGIVDAEVKGTVVKLRLTDPTAARLDYSVPLRGREFDLSSINTGVPHAVAFTDDIEKCDVKGIGKEIRFHSHFQPAGTNVNFVQMLDRHAVAVRTYERGVEDETLACGTGAVASALISHLKGLTESPVSVRVRSGEALRIHFESDRGAVGKVYLEGGATVVYEGRLWPEALQG